MDRWERRKAKRMLDAVEKKAKEDMYTWIMEQLTSEPSSEQVKAWKAGYIAGINRASGTK